MKLIKQSGRILGNKEYFKYITVIPNKTIEELEWKGGEELKVEVKNKKLIIEKEN